jgi:hypothetical protein
VFHDSKTCLLLGTLLLGLAFPALAQTYPDNNPQVAVFVYNDTGVPANVLTQAEEKAARIFARAGVWITWKSCLDCSRLEWPTSLAVRIVPGSVPAAQEIFGMAFLSAEGTGCYTDVFYDRAAKLQSAWNLNLSETLGAVMAHELGHLLLGSNSHAPAGIMRARWEGQELNRMARGNLLFTDVQSEHMRAKLFAARSQLTVAAQTTF